MPARLRLSCGMKTWKLFLLSVLESLEFGWQAIRYALVLVAAFFRQRASWGCEMVAMRSQLTLPRKYPPEETAPPSVSPGVSPPVGVAVQGMDRMEVCGRADETQDGAPVACVDRLCILL